MKTEINRREFLQMTAAGSALYFGSGVLAMGTESGGSKLISPGCRGTKVKVARLYIGIPGALWPKPEMDLSSEIKSYESQFAKFKGELQDVDFVPDQLITSVEQLAPLKSKLEEADGVLVIHLSMGARGILDEILKAGKPTVMFAAPYSGHEWTSFGGLQKQDLGAKLECMLTTDYSQLALAIRPFRAIHHLREAKVLNLTTRSFDQYAAGVKDKFGTEIKKITLEQVEAAYNAVDEKRAKEEMDLWMKQAEKVVEPPVGNIFKSCRLALAMEDVVNQENATALTIDCYGTMWDKTIKLPAYPCLGFTRLNNLGLGGICESDLQSAMTHIMFQGLTGRPSFISDPTMDESKNGIILAHCLGTTKMDGPNGPAAPYKLRTVMERREGVVPQVQMRTGQKVTQGILIGMDSLPYFTGEIIEAPVGLEHDRGCRTKITVRVDGDATKLWKNWHDGLHRQTVYGDVTKELQMFCKFKQINLLNEAV
jgi:hypothetical protein